MTHADGGLLAVADFGTSKKYDVPERQHGYIYRTFWRAVFEVSCGKNLLWRAMFEAS